ncbi:hypothetical protein PENSPDRAFT_568606 [Peniophora sp. CONT]|nr:hypothetical protein PENSPDRAFT_568606 [Peniophora sp. CONT]
MLGAETAKGPAGAETAGRALELTANQTVGSGVVLSETATANPHSTESDDLDSVGVWLLTVQHLSSAWGGRSAEFAFPLYIIELFKNTLLPASLYGFIVTAAGILLAGSIGIFVDRSPRLRAARMTVISQKICASLSYTIFLILFTRPHTPSLSVLWATFVPITLLGSFLTLSAAGTTVAIERDWVSALARGRHEPLTLLNGRLRRIDLLCKLLAPLAVSGLTAGAGYAVSAAVLLALMVGTAAFEFVFLEIVYRRFPVLAEPRPEREEYQEGSAPRQTLTRRTSKMLKRQARDWREFVAHPIFLSSLSAACLYMTVLSFDGIFISYLKAATDFSDPFVAGMRALCVLMGLVGTFAMPFLDKWIGLTRAASWSIWSEVLALVPTVVSLFLDTRRHRAPWSAALLFGGMALSRIGLWSFDLAQLAQLQLALDAHPRANTLAALQIALQNVASLAAYALTIGWHEPKEYKFAAVASLSAVGAGAIVYVFGYARRVRGHVFHFEKIPLLFKTE